MCVCVCVLSFVAGINLAWSGEGAWSDMKQEDDDLAMMQRLDSTVGGGGGGGKKLDKTIIL